MNTYRMTRGLPDRVRRALALAAELGFTESCLPEVGRLLRVLVAQAGPGTVGEIGTGCGVGAAWMSSGLARGQRFVSVERDAERHAHLGALR